jgi:hypothetical protein
MPRLPSSQNVPQVQGTRDPGVQIPAGAFKSTAGIVAEELSPAIQKLAEISLRQDNRRDTIERSSLINQYNEEVNKELMRVNAESDLSREDVLNEFGSFMTKRRQELIESHAGSNDSRTMLETRLQDIGATFTGQAAGISVKIGKEKVKTTFNYAINPLIQRAAQNPTLENINKQLLGLETTLNDLGPALDPTEQASFKSAAQEEIALGAVNNLLARNRVDSAEALIDIGGVGRYLSPEKLRQTLKNIETIRFERDKQPTTKEVLNLDTGQLQFATEAQIAANPRLVPKGAEGKELTSAQRLAAGYALRTEQSSKVIDEVGSKFTGFESRMSGSNFFPQDLKSEDRQRFEQAQRNFVNAVLRRESGAAVSPSEFESAEQQYFPRPGDGEAVLAQKQQNRTGVIQALKLEAGEAFKQLKDSVPKHVKIKGKDVLVGSIVTNSKGKKGRVEQDGSITILGE